MERTREETDKILSNLLKKYWNKGYMIYLFMLFVVLVTKFCNRTRFENFQLISSDSTWAEYVDIDLENGIYHKLYDEINGLFI